MNKVLKALMGIQFGLICMLGRVYADDPKEMVKDYSDRMIEILQGPVSKLFGALILLIGVTALLRGRHGIAVSCGLAFIMLLFLPIFLQHVGN